MSVARRHQIFDNLNCSPLSHSTFRTNHLNIFTYNIVQLRIKSWKYFFVILNQMMIIYYANISLSEHKVHILNFSCFKTHKQKPKNETTRHERRAWVNKCDDKLQTTKAKISRRFPRFWLTKKAHKSLECSHISFPSSFSILLHLFCQNRISIYFWAKIFSILFHKWSTTEKKQKRNSFNKQHTKAIAFSYILWMARDILGWICGEWSF